MSVIDDLISGLSDSQRAELEKIRRIVHEMAPDAEEVMTYGMPGFKYKKKYLLSFAAFKDHLSLFPGSEPIDVLKSRLGAYKLSKGTIQFTLDNPLPDKLVRDIVAICITRNEK